MAGREHDTDLNSDPNSDPHGIASNGTAPNEIDTARIAAAVTEILLAIGEDPSRAGLVDTPERVAHAYAEFFSGVGADAAALLEERIDADADDPDAASATGDLVLIRHIAFRSICEHHLLPFTGVAHVAYLPGDRIVGLGRVTLVVATLASRPQLQERLTEEIAEVLSTGLRPRGVLVVLDTVQQCLTTRGDRQPAATTVTMASRGALSDPGERAGVLALIGAGDAR